MQGLSDRTQAILVGISGALIAAGGIVPAAGAPWWVGIILGVLGAVGFGIKEALGVKPTSPEPTTPQQPKKRA